MDIRMIMKDWLFFHTLALAAGIVLDLIVGDPHKLPHPVRAIGRLILLLEKKLYNKDRAKQRGALLWILVSAAVTLVTGIILFLCYRLNPWAGMAAEAVFCAYALAAASLCRESRRVEAALGDGDIRKARQALSMIVGRDTKALEQDEIIRAAVETVAENTSDGVIAPLLYLAVGGPVLGFLYKAVNTMDSMLGYRNERYLLFGRTAAKADDVMNFLPSRLSAVLMIGASYLCGLFSGVFNGRAAFTIWRRDRKNHPSPNSAQTEAVCAGALGLRLGGTHTYQGIRVEKPTIGEERRRPGIRDIGRANLLMLVTELLCAGIVFSVLILVQMAGGC